jgi:Domain of unknown function (DUF4234)
MLIPFNPSVVKVILLSIFTCGIYYIYWTFKFNSAINTIHPERPTSSGMVLLAILCFPLHIYLFYQWGKKLYQISEMSNSPYKADDNSVLLAVFGFLMPLVSAGIAQDQLNNIYASKGIQS